MNRPHANSEDTITTLFIEILMPMSATWHIHEQTPKPLVENQGNSTFGLLCYWLSCGKQQTGRGRSSKVSLESMPTLDVRELSAESLTNAERIFNQLKISQHFARFRKETFNMPKPTIECL